MGHRARHVNGGAVQTGKELPEAAPIVAVRIVPPQDPGVETDEIRQGSRGGGRDAQTALPRHLGGDALGDGAGVLPVPQDIQLVMGVPVDEAGRRSETLRLQDKGAVGGKALPHLSDDPSIYKDVAGKGRRAASVCDHGAANKDSGHGDTPFSEPDLCAARPSI